jgi:hypothetical protein
MHCSSMSALFSFFCSFCNFADWICISDGINLPTPKYNCSILEDIFLEENEEFINSTFADWKALPRGISFIKSMQSILIVSSFMLMKRKDWNFHLFWISSSLIRSC